MSNSRRRQANFRKAKARQSLARNKRQEKNLPTESFTEKDFPAMAKRARAALERNRRMFDA
ncbi:hypothetical protein [Corynebacterium hindlerae]|uniref:hypothetical protein n=1 Tax=Corynebacterium hindlerae TaxID=699041 RepID=UPI003AAE4799